MPAIFETTARRRPGTSRSGTALLLCWGLVLGIAPLRALADSQAHVYHAERVWTGSGAPMNDAVVVARDGKIEAVGPRAEIEIPENAVKHDLGAAVIIPGLIAAETGLGGGSPGDERALTPEIRAIDGFDFYQDVLRPLSGGVTTAQLTPLRSRLVPGRSAVVKLAGTDPTLRTLVEDGDLRLTLAPSARNPARIYDPVPRLISRDQPVEPTRPQPSQSLAGAVSILTSIFEAAQGERAANDAFLKPFQSEGEQSKPIAVEARSAAEIRTAVELAKKFHLSLLLIAPSEFEPFLEDLEGWKPHVRGVVIVPRISPGRILNVPIPAPGDPMPRDPWDDARALMDAGIPVCLSPLLDDDLSEFLFVGGLFTEAGLSAELVLPMMTKVPADLLGISDRVGSIAPGKDADFVVLSGDPFGLHSVVREVYVGGERAWSREAAETFRVIRAGTIQTGDGSSIDNAALVIEGKTIRAVGTDVSAPPGAKVETYPNAVITPGFLDLATDLGLGGGLSISSFNPPGAEQEGGEEGSGDGAPGGGSPFGSGSSVGLETKLGERLESDDPAVAIARTGGVTTVLTGPRGSAPGPLVAFKLSDVPDVLRDPVAIRFSIGGNLVNSVATVRRALTQGKAYADSWTKYEAELKEYETKKKEYEVKKKEYDAAKAKYDAELKAAEAKKAEAEKKDSSGESTPPKAGEGSGSKPEETPREGEKPTESGKPAEGKDKKDAETAKSEPAKAPEPPKAPEEPKEPKKPSENASLEPYRALFAGKIPAFVDARRLDAIQAAVKLFRDDFQVPLALLNAEDAFRATDLLLEKKVKLVVGPTLVREVVREEVNLPQVLATHEIPFAVQSEASTGVKNLPHAVKFAVRKGLGAGDALAALTVDAAELLGLSDRVGVLAAGKDADLVVWSGPPFALSSRVLAVMINGKWVQMDSKASNLQENR